MTDKLTDEDKHRIEQEADTKAHAYNSSMMNIEWQAYYKGYRTGATNATIYEREQQAELKAEYHALCERTREPLAREEDLHKYRNALQTCYDREKKLEAERSELRNKVIDEAIGLFKDSDDFTSSMEWSIIQKLNSLKTK